MTHPTTTTLPPLLKKFLGYRPSDIHEVAAKVHLMADFEMRTGNILASAVWNEDKTALIVSFTGGIQTTLLAEGFRLLVKCTCNQWQPARNCPHIVVVWATLKRVVSPDTLPHIRFNRQMLLDMKRFTDQEPVSLGGAAPHTSIAEKTLLNTLQEARRLRNEGLNRQKLQTASSQFRLVIEAS